MGKIANAFRNMYLFSKEDIIDSFKLFMEHIEFDEDNHYTNESKQKKIQLCNEFFVALQKCKLPTLTELWWYYDYEITGRGIFLNLCLADEKNIELDEDNETISMMSSTVESTLIKIECEYLTVEQFAKIQDVSPVTVRQWIRRGKLRNAKKMGRDWFISSFEDKPSRGYMSVQYSLAESTQIEKFPLVAAAESIFIYQDDKDKSVFHCIFENFKSHFYQSMQLKRKEVEEIELAIISSGKAKVESNIQFVPMQLDRKNI